MTSHLRPHGERCLMIREDFQPPHLVRSEGGHGGGEPLAATLQFFPPVSNEGERSEGVSSEGGRSE